VSGENTSVREAGQDEVFLKKEPIKWIIDPSSGGRNNAVAAFLFKLTALGETVF
jgi:hypothetical protein